MLKYMNYLDGRLTSISHALLLVHSRPHAMQRSPAAGTTWLSGCHSYQQGSRAACALSALSHGCLYMTEASDKAQPMLWHACNQGPPLHAPVERFNTTPCAGLQAGEQAQAALRDSLAAAQQAQQDSGSANGDSPAREPAAEQLAELQGEAEVLRDALEARPACTGPACWHGVLHALRLCKPSYLPRLGLDSGCRCLSSSAACHGVYGPGSSLHAC